MDWIEATGLFGSFLTSITFIPQVYKTWQTKKAGDLSLAMLLIVLTSCMVWMVYGVALSLRPVIIANGIIGALSILLIYFKLTFKQ
jgi:MtN3 and saliva related transmembrane protein